MNDGSLDPDAEAEVESFVVDWLSEHDVPGAALAVVDGEDLVYAEGFGARRLDHNDPATPDTLFGVGSCTKSFTAIAVVQLAADGHLDVEDPVDDYLPHLADVPGDPVTIRELLTHTSGMPSDGSAGPLISRPLGLGQAEVPLSSDADFRRHVEGSVDRRVTDREAFFYYNSGYTMLGQVVEAVSRQPFAEYVEENVLSPLGMDRSTFSRADFEAAEDRMTPYVEDDGDFQEVGFPFDPLIHAPGGLVSSVAEMANYLRMYIGDGTFRGESVVASGGLEEMTTPVGTFGTYFDGREIGYGYGLTVEQFLGDRLIGHGGSIGVSTAWFGYLEEAELGLALACTTGPEAHPMVVGPAILALLQGERPAEVVPHYRLVSALEAATGEYESYRGIGTAQVERESGTLGLVEESAAAGRETFLTPTAVEDGLLRCTTTEVSGIQDEVRFEFGDDGVDLFFERSRYRKSD
ncbi:penicillin-binding protein [Halobacteriales archaeon QS_1_68_20]|nr:MAG: penicillin-binding protein [Halobacteriales archaeon QS_1_68_20]